MAKCCFQDQGLVSYCHARLITLGDKQQESEKLKRAPERKPYSRPPNMHFCPTKKCYVITKPKRALNLEGTKSKLKNKQKQFYFDHLTKCLLTFCWSVKAKFDVILFGLLQLSCGEQPSRPRRSTIQLTMWAGTAQKLKSHSSTHAKMYTML